MPMAARWSRYKRRRSNPIDAEDGHVVVASWPAAMRVQLALNARHDLLVRQRSIRDDCFETFAAELFSIRVHRFNHTVTRQQDTIARLELNRRLQVLAGQINVDSQ